MGGYAVAIPLSRLGNVRDGRDVKIRAAAYWTARTSTTSGT